LHRRDSIVILTSETDEAGAISSFHAFVNN
jgi:hypothetical protein